MLGPGDAVHALLAIGGGSGGGGGGGGHHVPAGGPLAAPLAAAQAVPPALFADPARQFQDATTILQAAVADEGAGVFDGNGAFPSLDRRLQSWVVSPSGGVVAPACVDATFKLSALLPAPPPLLHGLGGSPNRAATVHLPVRWLRTRGTVTPLADGGDGPARVLSVTITYGAVGNRPAPFSPAVLQRVQLMSATCAPTCKAWFPSGLIDTPRLFVRQGLVAPGPTFSTALSTQLTVSVEDPVALTAILSYLLHVAAHAECCEGVSSTRFPLYFKNIATSAIPVNHLGFPFQSEHLPCSYTSRSGEHIGALEPSFPSPVLSGGTTLAVAASTLRSVNCVMFIEEGPGGSTLLCAECRRFKDDSIASVYSKNAREYQALMTSKQTVVFPRRAGSRNLAASFFLPDVRSPQRPEAAREAPLINIGKGKRGPGAHCLELAMHACLQTPGASKVRVVSLSAYYYA